MKNNENSGSYKDREASCKDGVSSYEDGTVSCKEGTNSYEDGEASGKDGADSYKEGVNSYNDGAVSSEYGGVSYEDGGAKGIEKPSVWSLFFSFFKIGLFTFGGGYAMLPLIEREVVTEQRWVTQDEYLEGLVVCESIPGAVAVKQAVSIGIKCSGYLGSIASTLGVALPSFLIILLVAIFFDGFQDIAPVNNFIEGVKPVIIGLLLSAAFSLGLRMINSRSVALIALAAFIAVVFFNINPMVVMAISVATHVLWFIFYVK